MRLSVSRPSSWSTRMRLSVSRPSSWSTRRDSSVLRWSSARARRSASISAWKRFWRSSNALFPSATSRRVAQTSAAIFSHSAPPDAITRPMGQCSERGWAPWAPPQADWRLLAPIVMRVIHPRQRPVPRGSAGGSPAHSPCGGSSVCCGSRTSLVPQRASRHHLHLRGRPRPHSTGARGPRRTEWEASSSSPRNDGRDPSSRGSLTLTPTIPPETSAMRSSESRSGPPTVTRPERHRTCMPCSSRSRTRPPWRSVSTRISHSVINSSSPQRANKSTSRGTSSSRSSQLRGFWSLDSSSSFRECTVVRSSSSRRASLRISSACCR